MKADFSTNDLIHIQVASRLSDLLFDELQKINIDGAPLTAQRNSDNTVTLVRRPV
jgi:hypothetical protein